MNARRVVSGIACALAMTTMAVGSAGAQRPGRPFGGAARVARAQARANAPGDTGATRALLERRVQQTMARVVRNRVGLSDAQMRQLAPVNRRYESERRELLQQERALRQSLRAAVLDSGSADQGRVQLQLDSLMQLQRRRVDILDREQRDLSGFLTPVQRAKYLALQEQIRRRVEQMRRQSADSAAASPR